MSDLKVNVVRRFAWKPRASSGPLAWDGAAPDGTPQSLAAAVDHWTIWDEWECPPGKWLPRRPILDAYTHEGDDEAQLRVLDRKYDGYRRVPDQFLLAGARGIAVKKEMEKTLAAHMAQHPDAVGLTIVDFNWIVHEFLRPSPWDWVDPPLLCLGKSKAIDGGSID